MSPWKEKARGALARLKQALAGWAWTPLVGRAAGYLLGFVLLALVGSGRLARWISPPPRLSIAVAEAATSPSGAASSSASPSASGTASPESAPAGAEVAAGNGDGGAPPDPDAGTASPGVAPDGKVILNLATEEDLRRLPGVGRGRAQAILALRQRLKKFTRVEDLLKIKGIGRRGLVRLRPLVRVD
jgi:competence protein ComEA